MSRTFDYNLIGLSLRDIRVYEALLKSQETTSVRSIAETTNMNRGVVFESIKKLTELGLLGSNQRGKQKRFFANDPNVLKGLVRARQDELLRSEQAVDEYIASLKAHGKTAVPPQFAAMYEGEEEIAALLRDVLATVSALPGKSYCIISAADIRGYLYRKFSSFTRQRVKLGLHVRSIGTKSSGEAAPLSERKVLPLDSLSAPACYVIIYGNKVAQISLHDNLVPYGIVTHNQELTRLQQLLFDRLWDSLPSESDDQG